MNISKIVSLTDAAYVKDKRRTLRVFIKESAAVFVFTIVSVTRILSGVPFFSKIIGVSVSIKNKAAENYGKPSLGHTEPALFINKFASINHQRFIQVHDMIKSISKSEVK